MTVHGKVKGKVVVPEKGARLPDGADVEIRIVMPRKKKRGGSKNVQQESLSDLLQEFAGTITNAPADLARNHDHYLHGKPKK
jgi:hypothetical protein